MAISIQIKQSDLSPAAWSALNNAKIKSQFLRDSLEFYVSYQRHFDKVEKDINCIKEAILSSKIITEVSADIHDKDTINNIETAETVEQHKNNELNSSNTNNHNIVQNDTDNIDTNKNINFNNFNSNSYDNSNMTAAKVIDNKDNKRQKNIDDPKTEKNDDIEDSINNLINSI